MCNRIKPDFDQWSNNILDRSELAEALEQAYSQGYSAGSQDKEVNWWEDYDKSLENSPYLCASSLHLYEDDNV